MHKTVQQKLIIFILNKNNLYIHIYSRAMKIIFTTIICILINEMNLLLLKFLLYIVIFEVR